MDVVHKTISAIKKESSSDTIKQSCKQQKILRDKEKWDIETQYFTKDDTVNENIHNFDYRYNKLSQ